MNLLSLPYDLRRWMLLGCLLLTAVFQVLPLEAQQEASRTEIRQLSQQDLDKYRQDSRFQYGPEPIPQKRETRKRSGNSQVWEIAMYLLLGVVLLGLAFLLIYYGLGKSSKKLDTQSIPDLEEVDIRQTDLNTLLQQRIEQGEYRSAVRLLYLQLLKALSAQDWIEWQPNKTNSIYEQEMANSPLAEEFSRLTLGYEYIWYGQFPIGMELFLSLQEKFQQFHHQLSRRS